MAGLLWRMPAVGEPAAKLIEVGVAEVAEALEAPLRDQLRVRVDKDVLVVYAVTAERRAIGVVLFRHDDSFVWRVARAKPMVPSSRLGSGGVAMSELPDFTTMTKEEIGDWFLNNDTSALVAAAEPAAEPMVQVDEHGVPVMRPATFRLPPSMLEWLEQAAGRDREGKSGIVRRALQEYRERHGGLAA